MIMEKERLKRKMRLICIHEYYTLQYIHISYYPNQRKGFSITKIIGVISTVECTRSSKCLFWVALASRHLSGQKPTFPDNGTQYAISNPL